MFANTYFKTQDHNFENFFTSVDTSTEVLSLKKEMNVLNKQMIELSQKLCVAQSKAYIEDFTPIKESYILDYTDRNYNAHRFDLYTGMPTDEVENAITISCGSKHGTVSITAGYCYPLGAVITRKYKYTIASDNSKVSTKLMAETLVPMFEEKTYSHEFINSNSRYNRPIDGLALKNASEFINTFFGIEKELNFDLRDARHFIKNNASFEIIIKTCENPDALLSLLRINTEKAVPIYTLIGCKKEEYEILSKENLIVEFLNVKSILKQEDVKEKIQKTNMEIIQLIKQFKEWEDELNFWDISYYGNLFETLVKAYVGGNYPHYYKGLSKFYPFGKYCHYVVTEVVNQGFTNVSDFVSKLTDYIRMCEDMNVKPVLYSSYITQTHDITSRNYKIKLTEEQEKIFASRYSDFKTFKGQNYIVVAPKNSTDVKEEGNELNHCVASYIKRILDNETKIYFLRSKKDIEARLITIEVKDNKIVQARGNHNRHATEEEMNAIIDFARKNHLRMSTI